ncbi:MAG TPA: DUF418 domain-containing protein [Staphylococcus sp.]|nr:DUF418 domain-containing protein [Staphylococcus sp.]
MSPQSRLFELDALRGFSLFGIILMNILVFSFPYEEIYLPGVLQGNNEILFRFVTLFVISSFYPIFTMLFGYGLGIMHENSKLRGKSFYPFIYRRLAVLMVFGLLHGYFIFNGDILFGYAFTGMMAVLFIKLEPKTLIMTATAVFIFKICLLVIPISLAYWNKGRYEVSNYSGKTLARLIDIKQSGHYFEFLQVNGLESKYSIIDIISRASYFDLLPYILVGIAAQKLSLITKIQYHPQRAMMWGSALFIIGYLIKLPLAIDYANNAFSIISSMVGGPILAMGYILIFTRLCQYIKVAKVLNIFKYPGKLSLSVYLSQSIIFAFIYYDIGLGLYNKLPLYQSYVIVVIVYSLQLIGCYLYLKYFKYGPVEWFWRKATYLK